MKNKRKDINGIICINKDEDWTSFDVVAKIRGILKTKVGHSGTLDPMATGLLIILVGNACRLEKYLSLENKEYIAKIKLGIKTDTKDIVGEKIAEDNVLEYFNSLTDKEIINKIVGFKGKMQQIPPKYSALKYNGQPLYNIAREKSLSEKEIEEILNDKKRNIEIHDIDVLNIDRKEKEIDIRVNVSKGTYIRSLAEDIADVFKTYGTLKSLKRISVGKFNLDKSIDIKTFQENAENIQDKLIKIEDVFEELDALIVENFRLKIFLNGTKITKKYKDGIYRLYMENGKFIGLRCYKK